ncbi:MAG: 50S ribosomal protein L21 [Thermodesulfobacteriota bacterium]|nr:50S ribosomal protein L21 [Thermodesulfobacteriota bacterium]
MSAIIETGGKQYRVSSGDEIRVEKLQGEAGDTVTFDHVLLTTDEEDVKIGRPYLENSEVRGKIIQQGKNRKIVTLKYKRRKGYHRKIGHRQPFTLVKIENIES